MKAEWKDEELLSLEVDLSNAPRRVQRASRDKVWDGAGIVQRGMKKQATGHRHLRHLPKSITRDMVGPFEAEIGYDTHVPGAQGRLAHIIVYGSVNNAPQWDHTLPLRRETPRIVDSLADAAEDSMLGGDDA